MSCPAVSCRVVAKDDDAIDRPTAEHAEKERKKTSRRRYSRPLREEKKEEEILVAFRTARHGRM